MSNPPALDNFSFNYVTGQSYLLFEKMYGDLYTW